MEDLGHHSFCESTGNTTPNLGGDRCKSLYDNNWDNPGYFPFHSYKKTKKKSVSYWKYNRCSLIEYYINLIIKVNLCLTREIQSVGY